MKNLKILMRKSDGVLRFRLFVYGIAFAHLVIMCARLLGKNLGDSEDPTIQMYAKYKWKLITLWFNLLYYGYIPICLYCDWRELKEGEVEHVKILKNIRDFMFTNLLLPTTAFADILFWRLWYHDKSLLIPPAMETVINLWEQHSMHTVSLALAIFDLIFIPRERPKNMAPGIIAMLAFISVYIAVCLHSVVNKEYIYPLFKVLSPFKLFVLVVYTYTSFLFYHSGQWVIIDLIHRQEAMRKKVT